MVLWYLGEIWTSSYRKKKRSSRKNPLWPSIGNMVSACRARPYRGMFLSFLFVLTGAAIGENRGIICVRPIASRLDSLPSLG